MSAVNIDEGTILEALNDKTDRDMRNVNTVAKADAVVDYQIPTVENNYTWFRKYASGWVEQGGTIVGITPAGSGTATLLITMADTNYNLLAMSNGPFYSQSSEANNSAEKTSASLITISNGSHNTCDFSWEVKGMAASN